MVAEDFHPNALPQTLLSVRPFKREIVKQSKTPRRVVLWRGVLGIVKQERV